MRFVDRSQFPNSACSLDDLPQRCCFVGLTICLILRASLCFAETDNDFFESRIRPALEKHCIQCHGSTKQEGGLRLDSRTGWEKGGDSGPAVLAGKPNESLLIQAVKYNNPNLQMPPSNKLAAHEIADFEVWVTRGAPDPRRELTTETTPRMTVERARSFWSFQALRRPNVLSTRVKTGRLIRSTLLSSHA